MSSLSTFEQWHQGLRIFHRAHSRAAVLFERRNLAIGLPTVLLTAISGTTAFTTLASEVDQPVVKIMTGIMSITAAVLAALQTFLRYSELAEKHKAAAQNYGMLRRELEEVLVQCNSTSPHSAPPQGFMRDFRMRWDSADKEAPNLPQRIYNQAEEHVKAGT